jgi:hypothetical protein
MRTALKFDEKKQWLKCYALKKYFRPKNWRKNIAFLTQNKAKLSKNLIITLVFEKNSNFFHGKLSKIAENSD